MPRIQPSDLIRMTAVDRAEYAGMVLVSFSGRVDEPLPWLLASEIVDWSMLAGLDVAFLVDGSEPVKWHRTAMDLAPMVKRLSVIDYPRLGQPDACCFAHLETHVPGDLADLDRLPLADLLALRKRRLVLQPWPDQWPASHQLQELAA
ncbi:MAG: hypothetical protein KGH75_05840 [Rhodospirillales bacterium]|nr:hypothetical protein [Rhodospirillales bacterium]